MTYKSDDSTEHRTKVSLKIIEGAFGYAKFF